MSDITPTAPTPPTPHAAGPIRTSPLAAFHAAHGAHMVPFSGWEMPLYYSGILEEHRAVRHPLVDAVACPAVARPNGGPVVVGAISRSSSRRR